jgi:DNA-binding transcriptional LysR family regulator
LIPGFIAKIRATAPNAELRIRPSNMGVTEALLAGRVDLAIGSFRQIPAPFVCEPLFQETRVWVLSADHPAAANELTLERLASLPHLIISATGEDEQAVAGYVSDHGLERLVTRSEVGLLQGALAARGLRRVVGLTTPHFPAALAVLSQSDMAAPLPRRLAAAFADRYRLKLFDPPYDSPPFDIMALWHRDHGEDRAVTWLRGVLREVAADL